MTGIIYGVLTFLVMAMANKPLVHNHGFADMVGDREGIVRLQEGETFEQTKEGEVIIHYKDGCVQRFVK